MVQTTKQLPLNVQNAMRTKARTGNYGGRPKGSIGSARKKGMATREAFAAQVEKNIQPLFDSLFKKAVDGDVLALNSLLDRAWGKAPQSIDLNANIKLSLAELAIQATKIALEEEPTFKEIEPT